MASPIIVALDFSTPASALGLVARLEPELCRLKVGNELFTRAGPALVQELVHRGFDVFLDLKFHDIPNTVAGACRSAGSLGVWMMTVHASGGRAMLEAARNAVQEVSADRRPLVVGVTVLTSLDIVSASEVGFSEPPANLVLRMAELVAVAGLDGAVCSPHEASLLRAKHGDQFKLVTPGIRPADWSAGDDQMRVLTASEAIANGANYLVIGRPITRSPDPLAALIALRAEVA